MLEVLWIRSCGLVCAPDPGYQVRPGISTRRSDPGYGPTAVGQTVGRSEGRKDGSCDGRKDSRALRADFIIFYPTSQVIMKTKLENYFRCGRSTCCKGHIANYRTWCLITEARSLWLLRHHGTTEVHRQSLRTLRLIKCWSISFVFLIVACICMCSVCFPCAMSRIFLDRCEFLRQTKMGEPLPQSVLRFLCKH